MANSPIARPSDIECRKVGNDIFAGQSRTPAPVSLNGHYGDCGTADAVARAARNAEPAQEGDAAEGEHRRLMSELSILEGGRYYYCDGYRYDHLADAVGYAQSPQLRAGPNADISSRVRFDDIELPDAADRKLMTALDISFEDGMYRFEGFSYEHLADAAGYARQRRRARTEAL
jgi:hypothetical protein